MIEFGKTLREAREAAGLDPRPLSAELTDIFNGRREPEIRERAPAAPSPSSPIAPQPIALQPSVGRDDLIVADATAFFAARK